MAISFVIFTGTLSTLTVVHAAVLPELTALSNYPGVIKILCVAGTKHSFALGCSFHGAARQYVVLECSFFSKGVHTSSISCFKGSCTVRELGLSC